MTETNLKQMKITQIGLHFYSAVNKWASNFGPRKRNVLPTGEEFIEQAALSFLYAMSKYMMLAKPKSNRDEFGYLQEGVDVLLDKIRDLSQDEEVLAEIFDLDVEKKPPQAEEPEDFTETIYA